jgi:hypothetical protein
VRAERGQRLAVASLGLAASLCLGLACGPTAPERSFECGAPERVTRVEGVHYEGVSCEAAIAAAESRPGTAYYRKACEQLAPDAGLPGPVTDAYVTSCEPAPDGGSILSLELCCPAR